MVVLEGEDHTIAEIGRQPTQDGSDVRERLEADKRKGQPIWKWRRLALAMGVELHQLAVL